MDKLCIFLKTYNKDFLRAKNLIESILKFNVDKIPVWIACPKSDLNEFRSLELASWINCLAEEDIPVTLTKEKENGIEPGYINQEILKLGFAELNLSEHYFCVDSDGIFLRKFTIEDFLNSESVPKMVLVQDKELIIDNFYYERHWKKREIELKKIEKVMFNNNENRVIKTCHNFQVFTNAYLERFKLEILEENSWDYLQCVLIAPYEFSWYNYFVQSRNLPHIAVEPYFKMIHTLEQFLTMKISGISADSISRGYMGVVVNSNFAQSSDIIDIESTLEKVLSEHLQASTIMKLNLLKLKNVFKNRIIR